MVALTNETPRIPALPRALATDAANRLDELERENAALRAKLDEYVNEAVALEISRAALEERKP
jgi:lipase chaperone LimK